jgi:uncharacterized integral membrane protein
VKQVLLIFIGIAIAGLAALFASENASVVSLSIFEFRSAQLPLFVWLVIALSVGLVMGLFIAAIVLFRAKTRERKIKQDLRANRNESLKMQKESELK